MHKLGSGALGRWRAHVLASAAPFIIAAVVGGCTPEVGDPQSITTSSVSRPVTQSRHGTVTSYTIDALSLRFDLPQDFVAVDHDELVFLARSLEPRSIFSIDRDDSGVPYEPEAGELVSEMRLGDVNALVVTSAVVNGLPPGIAANELLVDNGPQSFSVIMSARPGDLADMWDPFVASVQVESA